MYDTVDGTNINSVVAVQGDHVVEKMFSFLFFTLTSNPIGIAAFAVSI